MRILGVIALLFIMAGSAAAQSQTVTRAWSAPYGHPDTAQRQFMVNLGVLDLQSRLGIVGQVPNGGSSQIFMGPTVFSTTTNVGNLSSTSVVAHGSTVSVSTGQSTGNFSQNGQSNGFAATGNGATFSTGGIVTTLP